MGKERRTIQCFYAMDYPSTTQALFALIVMTIVLAFILVYCCWGTFSCAQTENMDVGEGSLMDGRESPTPTALVILPYRSMIYIGDGQTQQVYQIPIREDKPPSYRDIFNNWPSPPEYNSRATLAGSEPPPTYEQCVDSNNDYRASNSLNCVESNESGLSVSSLNRNSYTISPAQMLLSPSDLPRNFPNVFRARSLLTVVSPNSPYLQAPLAQSQTPISAASLLPSISSNPLSTSLSQTSTSSPCLPSSFNPNSLS